MDADDDRKLNQVNSNPEDHMNDHNDDKNPKLTELDRIIAEQDQRERDRDRLRLLDRIAERCPELEVQDRAIEWLELDQGDEALVVDRHRFAEGTGCYLMADGDDLLAVGPLGNAAIRGVVVIGPDGSRHLRESRPVDLDDLD